MTQDEIIELAIQGHASTRDAIRWAMNQEREACAKVALAYDSQPWSHVTASAHVADMVSISIGKAIRARG